MLKEIHTARSSEERKGGYSREKRGKEGIPEGREEGRAFQWWQRI